MVSPKSVARLPCPIQLTNLVNRGGNAKLATSISRSARGDAEARQGYRNIEGFAEGQRSEIAETPGRSEQIHAERETLSRACYIGKPSTECTTAQVTPIWYGPSRRLV